MKLWVHASILKSAFANAADKKADDDTSNVRPLKKLDSTCSNKSSVSSDGLSTRKEEWVWVLSEVIAGSTQDLFAAYAHNSVTSPKRNNNNTTAASTADATLTIRVLDPENDYADEVIKIAREHINMVDGGRGVLPANTFEENQALPSDLTQLTHLHEPAVLDCLHRRYQLPSGWEMYTSSGPILIAINPCRMVKALYNESTMKLYQRHGELLANGGRTAHNNNNTNDKVSSSSSSSPPPPHVFAVADSAYRGMIRGLDFARNKKLIEEKKESSALSNQSILVSGESGAGKTVTTKFLMQYLADLSRKVHSDHTATEINGKSSIEQRVLNSNPILEAFGNARTLRNDNSSRFGKFIEMRFSDRGRLLGAFIDTYLLEKARIVGHTCGEQTYHIFYEVLAKGSLTEAMRRELMIENTSTADFVITTSDGSQNNSKLCHSEFDDHCKMFLELRSAMGTLSFNQNEQMEIFQVVCALLHLSNLTLNDAFVDINDGEECKLNENNLSLKRALSLLGVPYAALDSAVTTVQFKAVDELVTKNLSTSQAAQAVQALIKGVYDSIFTILVGRINSCIAGASSTSDSGTTGAFIGLLDIFGFETFQKNAFEQFCINYCNESLQQQFNRFVFKLEQQEYIREGIRWDMIEFQDNQDTLDLIEKKHAGILTILDEQCRLGMRCNDKTFVSAVYSKCMSGNTRFGANRKQQSHGKFTIRHYAGVVEYSTDGFMEKNKDEIPMEASELLSQSTCAFVRDIAQVISAKTGSQNESKSSISRVSVGKQFSGQLQKLRFRIDETHPHYVRCIKPNEQLQPNHFDSNIVVDQLRCGGILEAIRVSRAGFPQRYTFEHFVARFSVLSSTLCDKRQNTSKLGNGISSKKKRASKTQANAKDDCEALVKLISQWILKDREHDPEVENRAEPEPDASSGTVSPKSFWKNKSASNSSKNDSIDISDAGIQVGTTKVFLIQDTFDIIERLRGQITMSNATKISSIVRMYLARKAYVIMLQNYHQARAQRKSLFEANPFNKQTKKYRAIDENLVGKVNFNVEGFEIVANGEREASTNPQPTDFMWHSIGHGRFVKKGEGGHFDKPSETSAECRSSKHLPVETPLTTFQAGLTSVHDHIDQEKSKISKPSTSTSTEQQSKPDSSVSRLVLTLEEKTGKMIAPASPKSFWSSQSSPRACSDSNISILEANNKKSASSITNKFNNGGMSPQSIKAGANLAVKKNTDANQPTSIWSSQASPRASSDANIIEAQTQISVVSNADKIKSNAIRPLSIKADANKATKKNIDTNQSRTVWSGHSSPRTSSDGNSNEATNKTFDVPSANKIKSNIIRPISIKNDTSSIMKNNSANVPSVRVPITNDIIRRVQSSRDGRVNSSASPTVMTNTQMVQGAQHPSEVRPTPKADATSFIKSTSNEPSSPYSFNAFPSQKQPVSVQAETKMLSHPALQPDSNHFGSNVHTQKRGKEQNREKRQDSSTQHSFNAFNESSFAPKPQINTFLKATSPRIIEEQHLPASLSNHSGQQVFSVAARRRAKAMNAATMVDNMSSSYRQMQPKPVQTATKPTAPVIAPPPLSSSVTARRNMKQKMHRNNLRTASESVSGSHSGSFSDFVDF